MNRINPRHPATPPTVMCYNCNERGHSAPKCPKSSTPVLYVGETKPEQQSVPYPNPNLVAPENLLVGDSYYWLCFKTVRQLTCIFINSCLCSLSILYLMQLPWASLALPIFVLRRMEILPKCLLYLHHSLQQLLTHLPSAA